MLRVPSQTSHHIYIATIYNKLFDWYLLYALVYVHIIWYIRGCYWQGRSSYRHITFEGSQSRRKSSSIFSPIHDSFKKNFSSLISINSRVSNRIGFGLSQGNLRVNNLLKSLSKTSTKFPFKTEHNHYQITINRFKFTVVFIHGWLF